MHYSSLSHDRPSAYEDPEREPYGYWDQGHAYAMPHQYPNPGNGNGPRNIPKVMTGSGRRLFKKLGMAGKRKRFSWSDESRMNFPCNRFMSQPHNKEVLPVKRKVGRPRKPASV